MFCSVLALVFLGSLVAKGAVSSWREKSERAWCMWDESIVVGVLAVLLPSVTGTRAH